MTCGRIGLSDKGITPKIYSCRVRKVRRPARDSEVFLYNHLPPLSSEQHLKQPEETVGRRSRRRSGSADVSHAVFDRTPRYRHLRNPFTPLKVFSDDQVAAVHEAALVILETQGMKVLSADARVRYRNAGADVEEATQVVRLPASWSALRSPARRTILRCTR